MPHIGYSCVKPFWLPRIYNAVNQFAKWAFYSIHLLSSLSPPSLSATIKNKFGWNGDYMQYRRIQLCHFISCSSIYSFCHNIVCIVSFLFPIKHTLFLPPALPFHSSPLHYHSTTYVVYETINWIYVYENPNLVMTFDLWKRHYYLLSSSCDCW